MQVATLGNRVEKRQQAFMSGQASAAKRTLATLVAWLALLCAQAVALPDFTSERSQPAAVAAPAHVSIARVESGATLVKAQRAAPHVKQGAGPDLLFIAAASYRQPGQGADATASFERPWTSGSIALPYRARAPPAPPRFTIFSNIT